MPLQRGEILGYDFNRMVVDFTMLNQSKTVRCAIRPKGRSLSSNSSSGKRMGEASSISFEHDWWAPYETSALHQK